MANEDPSVKHIKYTAEVDPSLLDSATLIYVVRGSHFYRLVNCRQSTSQAEVGKIL
jgi:hypothetical protein